MSDDHSSSPPDSSSDDSKSSPSPPSSDSSSPPPPSKQSSSNSPPSKNSNSGSPSPPSGNNNNNNNSGNTNNNNSNNSGNNNGNNSNSNSGNNKNNNNNSSNNNNSNSNSNDNSGSNGGGGNSNSNNNNSNNNKSNSNSNSNNSNNDNNNNNNKSPSKSGRQGMPAPPHGGSSRGGSSGNKALASSKESSSSSDNTNMIIGAAAGAGLLLLFIFILLVCCCCRKKKRRRNADMNYYSDPPRGNMTNDYYNSPQPNNWANNGPAPPMGGYPRPTQPSSAGVSSEHQWLAAPPPPPPMMSSSEMSSAGFSGPHGAALPPPHPAMALGFNQSSFSYQDLAAATNNFSQANLLGQGGFGYVHKGVLPNGKEIAVKSLKTNSGQGEREFQAEVDIISRVHHRHLVSLVGYCIAGEQRMLVYEFVNNGTLEHHLHGKGVPTMDWPTRIKIALGSAKGFAYLHEDCHPRIIHRDIKAANILLDDNCEAKVADFGLAKLSSDTNTHVSTRIMGTFGYLAPEYASSGKLTEKSDVYSYGIMLLELITGRRPIDIHRDDDDDTLVDWARPILVQVMEGGSYEPLVDPNLGGNYDPQEMLRMVNCAAASIRQSARRRPKMSQIVRALEGDVSLDALHEGVKPGQSGMFGSASSSDSDMRRYRSQAGLSSQEFSSSELGNTGDYGSSPANHRI